MFEIPLNNPISYDVSLVSVITADTPTPVLSPSPPPSSDSNDTMDGSGSDKCLLNYTGTVCTSYLRICSGQMTINRFDSSTESILEDLIPLTTASDMCKRERFKVEDFLCRVAFQPCDNNSYIHLPNRTTCEYIRGEICEVEWTLLQGDPKYSSLLNCNLLPDVSTPPACGKL